MYNTGKTIKKGIKMESLFEGSHNKVNIVKDATGMDLIIFIGNQRNILMASLIDDKTARNIPRAVPAKKPVPILKREVLILNQNAFEGIISFKRTEKTLIGVGKKSSLDSFTAASCQRTIHKRMDKRYRTAFLIVVLPGLQILVVSNIEHSLLWQLSANCSRILFI